MRRGDLAQEVGCRLAQRRGRGQIEPPVLDQRKADAAPQCRFGVRLAVGQLPRALDRLFVELTVLADEDGPFPERRVGGQLLKTGAVIGAPLIFLRLRLSLHRHLRRCFGGLLL